MKSKIISLLLMAIAVILPFTLQSCSDDDEEPVIGTSYWTSKDLKGHWASADDNGSEYIDFAENGTFSCDLGMGKNRTFGKYRVLNSANPQEIGVQFPNDGDTSWTVWTIEWLTSDKSEMQLSTFRLKKVK